MIDWAAGHDVVVLGAGAAGMTAAFVAAREGARVVLLEKTCRPQYSGEQHSVRSH